MQDVRCGQEKQVMAPATDWLRTVMQFKFPRPIILPNERPSHIFHRAPRIILRNPSHFT
jgi:hypothetical protein